MSGLFGSSIVDMAIGLFFLYWLLSIICSSIWEMIAALLKLRAADLERGIANLVCDPRVFHAVMAHPAITAVGNTDAIAEKELPSPIAQRVFGTLDAAIQDLAA